MRPTSSRPRPPTGIAYWRPEICLGQLRLPGCKADLRLPDMTVDEAAAAGVRTMIVGTTNRGGVLGEGWEGAAGAGDGARHGPGERAASPPRRHPGAARRRVAARPADPRRAPSDPRVRGRQRCQAARQAAVDGRHRLLDRKDVHRAGARKGDAGARHQGRFPRHRPDRHLHRRRRRLDRRGRLRFRLRRGRMAVPGKRSRPLGP